MNSALNLCIYAIGTLQHRGISPRLSRLRLSPHGVTSAGETTKAKEMWPILNLLLILAKSQRLSCFLELSVQILRRLGLDYYWCAKLDCRNPCWRLLSNIWFWQVLELRVKRVRAVRWSHQIAISITQFEHLGATTPHSTSILTLFCQFH